MVSVYYILWKRKSFMNVFHTRVNECEQPECWCFIFIPISHTNVFMKWIFYSSYNSCLLYCLSVHKHRSQTPRSNITCYFQGFIALQIFTSFSVMLWYHKHNVKLREYYIYLMWMYRWIYFTLKHERSVYLRTVYSAIFI